MREALAIGVGAMLGITTAGGAFVALTAEDQAAKRIAGIIAGAGLVSAAAIGALMLRSPATRLDAAIGAIGFIGLPSVLLASGFTPSAS